MVHVMCYGGFFVSLFFFLLAAPGSHVGDVTNYRARLVSLERRKIDINEVQVEEAHYYTLCPTATLC